MLIPNDYLMMKLYKQIFENRSHIAETNRLLEMCRPENPSWFSRCTCWLLSCIGRLMVHWGERLQSYSSGARNPLKTNGVVHT